MEANAQKQNALWNEKAKAFEETQVEGEVTSDNAYALFDGEQWILEDVGCLEVVVDEGQNAPKVLHEGMVEPELD